MSTLVAMDAAAVPARPRSSTATSITLLGCGTVGAALARLLESQRPLPAHITRALVRDPHKRRNLTRAPHWTTDPAHALGHDTAIVVELLGGLEPARTLVLEALRRRIPVVTANKTLLAHHGRELRDASIASATPLLYEAAVLAGVPFLGTFGRRPLAAGITGFTGILNGTSNYLLTRATGEGTAVDAALPEAQRLGYAEPDAAKDLSGTDAAEKLAVLLQHFASVDVPPAAIDTRGIAGLGRAVFTQAAELGGVIKPVASCDWANRLEAFAGPAFLPEAHPLSRVDGVENALLLHGRRGRLLFQGPGAGPEVTAATVLDDVAEVIAGTVRPGRQVDLEAQEPSASETGWLLSLAGAAVPRGPDVADYLGSFGVYVRSTTRRTVAEGAEHRGYLTWPAAAAQIESAAARLATAAGCGVTCVRALGEHE
jgi:homoserine dehydrogenase